MILKKGTTGASLPPPQGNIEGYINGQGHITKMSAMAINSKNHYKSSSEPEGL